MSEKVYLERLFQFRLSIIIYGHILEAKQLKSVLEDQYYSENLCTMYMYFFLDFAEFLVSEASIVEVIITFFVREIKS